MFLEEAELMKKFSHPNIVSILGTYITNMYSDLLNGALNLCCFSLGVCTDDVDETSAPLMILEYMPFGDLLSFLQTYKYEDYWGDI